MTGGVGPWLGGGSMSVALLNVLTLSQRRRLLLSVVSVAHHLIRSAGRLLSVVVVPVSRIDGVCFPWRDLIDS